MRKIFSILLICFFILTPSLSAQWKKSSSIYGGSYSAFASDGDKIFCAGTNDIIVSKDNGLHWEDYCTLIEPSSSFAVSGNNIYVGTAHGLYFSNNSGETWQIIPSINRWVSTIIINNGYILVGGLDGLFISVDKGLTWVRKRTDNIASLIATADSIYLTTAWTVEVTNDQGNSWNKLLKSSWGGLKVAINRNTIVASTGVCGFFISTDKGITWDSSNVAPYKTGNRYRDKPFFHDNILFSGQYIEYGIDFSKDNGCTWTTNSFVNSNIQCFFSAGNRLLVGTTTGIFYTEDNGITFINTGGKPLNITQVLATTNKIIAISTPTNSSGITSLMAPSQSVYESADNGLTWSGAADGLYNYSASVWIGSVIYNKGYIYAASSNGLYRKGENEHTWVQYGLQNISLTNILVSNNNLYATSSNKLYISKDNGISWAISALAINNSIKAICANDKYVFLVTDSNIFRLDNNGSSWSSCETGLGNINGIVTCITAYGNNIYTNIMWSLYQSTNNGDAWNYFANNLSVGWISQILAYNGNVFAIGPDGIAVTKDYNSNWSTLNDNLPSRNILSLISFKDSVFVSLKDYGIWKRSAVGLISSIANNKEQYNFELGSNYPNPFNPITKIIFSVPERSLVKLIVFDILGNVVESLIDNELGAGYHEIIFDGSQLASGVYFYKLTTPKYTSARKMLLIK